MTPDSIYRAHWNQPLPEDEIHRQQKMKERLKPGLEVELRGLGRFIYIGTWDTMHTFYPAEGQDLPSIVGKESPFILKRDLVGRNFFQLPYTLLADEVIIPT
ncbi:MAG: hypothetical protein K2J58_06250 [Muribaculaceae bacterium]|nr:hypothetical protein [Muribaculaceae bacterium]